MVMVEVSRWIIIAGYGCVVVGAWYGAGRLQNPTRRAAAILIATSATAWFVFYMWVATLDLSNPATLTAASLASRLAHLPAIGTFVALLIMLRDADKTAELAKVKIAERIKGE